MNMNMNMNSSKIDFKQELKNSLQELDTLVEMAENDIYKGRQSGVMTELWRVTTMSDQLNQVKKLKTTLVHAVHGSVLKGSAIYVKMTPLDDFISIATQQGKQEIAEQANKLKNSILAQHYTKVTR